MVVSADGSRYTGGAHGEPLVARFVWLPQQQQMLSADKLVADAKGWKVISEFVADQLRERVATRLSGEDMDPAQLQESLRNASRMIADGTGPQADNFSQFQPLTDDKGQITALRFVFPPYQVGPYSDGTQTADVPAAVLLRTWPRTTWSCSHAVDRSRGGGVDTGLQERVAGLLHEAGVRIGGTQPQDIQVHDPRFSRGSWAAARSAWARATWKGGGMRTSWMNSSST